MTPLLALSVALVGGLGAAGRYLVDTVLRERFKFTAPGATMCINAIGSFLLGLFTGLIADFGWHAVLATGLCGGFTTFSTAMLDAVRLWRTPAQRPRALWFLVGQLFVCAVFALAGALLFTAPPSN